VWECVSVHVCERHKRTKLHSHTYTLHAYGFCARARGAYDHVRLFYFIGIRVVRFGLAVPAET
jgi:hypothetical protein